MSDESAAVSYRGPFNPFLSCFFLFFFLLSFPLSSLPPSLAYQRNLIPGFQRSASFISTFVWGEICAYIPSYFIVHASCFPLFTTAVTTFFVLACFLVPKKWNGRRKKYDISCSQRDLQRISLVCYFHCFEFKHAFSRRFGVSLFLPFGKRG